MNRCLKCENENLKEEYNYCPVCGRVINQTAKEAAIEMLKTMRDFHIDQECDDSERENFKLSCVVALELAIRELERTAPEVPVQEQYVKNIVSKELFEIEKKRYKELKLFYFMNMLMFICFALNSIAMLIK